VSRHRRHWVALLLGAGLSLAASVRADPFQVWWQNTTFLRLDEHWSIGNYLDLRVTDAVVDYTTGFISPRIKYDINREWHAQMNTSWVNAVAADGRSKTDFFRLEFELNPRYAVGERWVFSSRNRFEFRWADGVDGRNERIRIRPQAEWIPPWGGPIKGIFMNNEVFYDFDQRRVTENRLTPFGLTFRPGDYAELRVYYLWRTTLLRGQWFDFHVMGVLLNLNF
jgi:hypothetical protein